LFFSDEALTAKNTLCILKGNNEARRKTNRKDRQVFVMDEYGKELAL